MSHQAVNWAIQQRVGGPSPKTTLWSIANYANEHWCSWPSQKTIADESEQSLDTVQRRVRDLEASGHVRRIPLQYAGRRSVDFFILQPSPFFGSSLGEVEHLLPRGYSVSSSHAAADCGSAEAFKPSAESNVSGPGAAANATANAAANAAALLRQQEPVEPGNLEDDAGAARARAVVITPEAHRLSGDLAKLVGHDVAFLPTRWARDGAYLAQAFLDAGYAIDMMRDEVALIMRRKGSDKPESLAYFRRPFAKAHAMLAKPHQLPIINADPNSLPESEAPDGKHRTDRPARAGQAGRGHSAFALDFARRAAAAGGSGGG